MNFAVPFLFGLAAVLMGRRDEQAPRRTTSGARQGADTATTTATTTATNTAGRIPTADEIAVALASLRQGGAAAPPHAPTPAAPPAAPNLDAVLAALRQQAGGAAAPPTPHTPTPAAPPAAPNLDAVLAALRQQAGGAAAPPQPGQPGAAASMTPIGPSSLGPQVLASRQLAAYYAQGGRDRSTIAALQRQMGGIPADGVVGPQTIARTAELNRGAAAPPLGGGAPTTRI